MRSLFSDMEKQFGCSRDALRSIRITFWVYVASIPIIVFLFLLPYIRAGAFTVSPYSVIYIAIVIYLLFETYRTTRVMLSIKKSRCVITPDRVTGVSTPNPYKPSIPFDIARDEIRGIAKTTISVGGMRSQKALVLNTETQKIVLLAIDRIDELENELNGSDPE